MPVYVDQLEEYPQKGRWCHLWAPDKAELEAMRQSLGLRATWVHVSVVGGRPFPHYDLRPSKRALAIKLGAIETTAKELVRMHLAMGKNADDNDQ